MGLNTVQVGPFPTTFLLSGSVTLNQPTNQQTPNCYSNAWGSQHPKPVNLEKVPKAQLLCNVLTRDWLSLSSFLSLMHAETHFPSQPTNLRYNWVRDPRPDFPWHAVINISWDRPEGWWTSVISSPCIQNQVSIEHISHTECQHECAVVAILTDSTVPHPGTTYITCNREHIITAVRLFPAHMLSQMMKFQKYSTKLPI